MKPQLPLWVPYQQVFVPPIVYHPQYLLQAKLPQTNQVSYYLHKYTLLSNFSALAHLIRRAFAYAFLHQQWHKHTHTFTPLRNDSNSIFTFDDPLHPSRTHPPIPIQKYFSNVFVLFLSDHYYSRPRQENTALLPIWYIPSKLYLWLQKSILYVTDYITSTSNLYTPRLPNYKNPRILCSLMYTVHNNTIYHTRLPPIIHYMLSIIIHTSTHHPIKTYHNSKTS